MHVASLLITVRSVDASSAAVICRVPTTCLAGRFSVQRLRRLASKMHFWSGPEAAPGGGEDMRGRAGYQGQSHGYIRDSWQQLVDHLPRQPKAFQEASGTCSPGGV